MLSKMEIPTSAVSGSQARRTHGHQAQTLTESGSILKDGRNNSIKHMIELVHALIEV